MACSLSCSSVNGWGLAAAGLQGNATFSDVLVALNTGGKPIKTKGTGGTFKLGFAGIGHTTEPLGEICSGAADLPANPHQHCLGCGLP